MGIFSYDLKIQYVLVVSTVFITHKMSEFHEMKLYLNQEDNERNRFSEYLIYCVTEFYQRANNAISVSSDKNKAKTSGFAKYVNKFVDVGVTTAVTASTCGAGLLLFR